VTDYIEHMKVREILINCGDIDAEATSYVLHDIDQLPAVDLVQCGAAQPVAWRFRYENPSGSFTPWTYRATQPPEYPDRIVEALYSEPRTPAVQERLASPGSPERTAELQYEAGMYESLYLAWKERAERAEAQVENMRLCLQRIVDTPVKKSFDYDKFGEIKNGSNSYDERWSAWHFQELARSAITSTVRTGKVCGYHDGCPPDKIPCHLCAHVQPAEGGK
jgi:hypothetical protein